MTNKRFLSSVLAFVAIGVSARAATITYCDSFCSANDIAAFNLATGGLGTETPTTFSSGNVSVNGDGNYQYLDPTGLLFVDESFTTLSVVAGALDAAMTFASFQITAPAGDTAVVVTLSAGQLSQYLINGITVNIGVTPVQFAFVNSAGGIDPITILHQSGGPLTFDSFNQQPSADMSDTPEVGTLLLIGSGLIAMRWMGRAKSHFFHTPRPA